MELEEKIVEGGKSGGWDFGGEVGGVGGGKKKKKEQGLAQMLGSVSGRIIAAAAKRVPMMMRTRSPCPLVRI